MSPVKHIFIFISLLLAWVGVYAQQSQTYKLDRSLNGTVKDVPAEGLRLTDDNANGSEGYYTPGVDFCVTLQRIVPCSGDNRFCLDFESFDIGPLDTLYFYDGLSISAPLLMVANNDVNNLNGERRKVFISPRNNTNAITIRFVTSSAATSSHKGFSLSAQCSKPCERATPFISSMFYRERNGIIYDSAYTKQVFTESGGSYTAVDLCYGDVAILMASCKYTNDFGWYTPNDTTTTFTWDLGIDRVEPRGSDKVSGVGLTNLRTVSYSDTMGCFDIVLSVTNDAFGCSSDIIDGVKVRVASNPIKTIVSPLPSFCNNDSMMIRVSSDAATAHLFIDTMHQVTVISRVNNVRTFIPDGPLCNVVCYSAPVEFTEFSSDRKVLSKEDICSICINYEHSYMGDYDLKLVCPQGRKATLKYRVQSGGMPSGAGGGGGIFTGYPYGGADARSWDGGAGQYCDTSYNVYGVGLDYCFSRSGKYTLVDGRPANTPTNAQHYLACNAYIDNVTVQYPARPNGYSRSGASDAGTRRFRTKHPSNHQAKTDYYKPADDFSSLIGCSLNGTWKVEICDEWKQDNGWIFSWSMELCDIVDERDCKYDVHIDSIRWELDTTVSKYVNGKFVGPRVSQHNDSISYAMTVDTAGYFPLKVHVYDDFGCVWDTNTFLSTIWAPKPLLGDTRVICNADTVRLTANDPHYNSTFTYLWSPNGDTAQSTSTAPYLGADTRHYYAVTVTNNIDPLVLDCSTADSVLIEVLPQPLPNFDASTYPMEGCEPLFEKITNHSQYTDFYYWDFGDGFTSTEKEPSHTYSSGVYDLKYYVSNRNGCKDSLILSGLVNVFANPDADFSWTPAFPTVTYPTVQFENRTNPQIDDMEYLWEVQYSPDNENSFTTLTDQHPTYTWTFGENTDGARFATRLVSTRKYEGPSGHTYRCSDTTENIVLVINDFIQFPTVVTANGDGQNDKFIIKNLVNGWAFPINSLDIYNRWGMKVFHAENIDDESDFWDPAATNSPTGTYFYRFSARGHTGVVEKNGVVEVIR